MSNASAVEALFFAALERATAPERAAYLDSACGGDAGLRRQVDKLLNAHPRVGDFLSKPAVAQLEAPSEQHDATQEVDASTDGPGAGPPGRKAPALARVEGGPSGDDEDSPLVFLQPSTSPDSLGRIAHYEVLEVLGRGGFGIVLRAFDEVLQRVVAVKVLSPELAGTSPPRKRFLREARSSAQVRHENVVHVYTVEEQPLPFLVMEFIPGETLQQRLDRTGPFNVTEVVQIGRQLAEGLAAAHATGLIHRDIKPANVLIEAGPHLRVKITDFGLARAADDASLSQSGLVAGTPMFMAPEQANGETLDHRADLFSLGSVLYSMCTGRPPFRATSTVAVLRRVVEDTPRPIREVIPEVPQWLCEVIARLHAKNPDDRFASAQEVADLLTRHLDQMQHPGHVMAPPVAGPAVKQVLTRNAPEAARAIRARSRTRRWAAAATLFLMVLGGLGFTEATGVTAFRGTVIRLFSPEGTLVVEVDDPGVSVRIDGSDIVITGAGAREIRLKPGRYAVEASKDGKLVRRELVTVTKNGRKVVRVSQEALASDAEAAKAVTAAAAWERVVASLSAAEQVKAVGARLKELNPGFDGNVKATIEEGVVTGLAFSTGQVNDISPVRALTDLEKLNCGGARRGKLTDLSPLSGLPLTHLNVENTPVHDLSPPKGMKLISLVCQFTDVNDLSPLQGMPLQVLYCGVTRVADLSPLKGMKLTTAQLEGSEVADLTPLRGMPLTGGLAIGRHVTDLTPLRGMPLESLTCAGATRLSDLSPLKGMPLRNLNLDGTPATDLTPLADMTTLKILVCGDRVTDLSPLKGLALERLHFSNFTAERDATILRALPTLQTINGQPAAEFWKEVDAQLKGR